MITMPIEEGAPQHQSQLNNTKIINAAIVQTTSPPPHLFLLITRYYYPGIQFAAWTSFEVCVIKETDKFLYARYYYCCLNNYVTTNYVITYAMDI